MAVIKAAHRFRPEIPALVIVRAPEPDTGVDKLVQAFIKSRRMESTRESYLKDIVGYLTHLSSLNRSLFEATQEDVDDWRLTMETAGLAESTRARRLSAVHGLYTYGVTQWSGRPAVSENPVRHVQRPRVGNNVQYSGLTSEQIAHLLRATQAGAYRLADRNWVRSAAVLAVLAHTGIRRNELVSANAHDLMIERGHRVLHVVRKGGLRQPILLTPGACGPLDQYLDGRTSGPLIRSEEGRRIDGSGVYRTIRRLGDYAFPELELSLHPHDMRHSCATLLYELGASDWEVQTILGHSDVRTTRRYNHARLTLDESPLYRLSEALA